MNNNKTIKKGITIKNKIGGRSIRKKSQNLKESQNWEISAEDFKNNGCLVNTGD